MIYIQEQWINRTENYRTGDSDVYETFTDDKGVLYKHLVKEHGRCTTKVYVDTKDGSKHIGWVFQKRTKYDDSNETFILETWVTLHTGKPEVTTTYHYADLEHHGKEVLSQ